jgi:hypothetical protein
MTGRTLTLAPACLPARRRFGSGFLPGKWTLDPPRRHTEALSMEIESVLTIEQHEGTLDIVAKTLRMSTAGSRLKWRASDRQPKQLVDKLPLRGWVIFPTHLARSFRIMWTASTPCNVRHAVENDWYPLASDVP